MGSQSSVDRGFMSHGAHKQVLMHAIDVFVLCCSLGTRAAVGRQFAADFRLFLNLFWAELASFGRSVSDTGGIFMSLFSSAVGSGSTFEAMLGNVVRPLSGLSGVSRPGRVWL